MRALLQPSLPDPLTLGGNIALLRLTRLGRRIGRRSSEPMRALDTE
jgi:hypothetical protein